MRARPGDPREAGLFARLQADIFGPNDRPSVWSEAAWAQGLRDPSAVILVLEDETGAIMALGYARIIADEAELFFIGTRPQARRQGAARRLLQDLLSALRARGARQVHLEVAADNAPARAFYAQAGFEECGLRRGYYLRPTGPQDAILMRYSW